MLVCSTHIWHSITVTHFVIAGRRWVWLFLCATAFRITSWRRLDLHHISSSVTVSQRTNQCSFTNNNLLTRRLDKMKSDTHNWTVGWLQRFETLWCVQIQGDSSPRSRCSWQIGAASTAMCGHWAHHQPHNARHPSCQQFAVVQCQPVKSVLYTLHVLRSHDTAMSIWMTSSQQQWLLR